MAERPGYGGRHRNDRVRNPEVVSASSALKPRGHCRMFPELNALLGVDTESPERGQFTLISGHKTDPSFLLHHFLSYYLKAGCNVCFVALSQSFSHYNIIAQKLGVNLSSARDQGQLRFLEGLRSYTQLLFTDTAETAAENPLRFLRTGSDLRPLYDYITAALTPSAGQQWKCPVLIIDDVGVLLSLGTTTLQVLDFIHYCRASVCSRYQGAVVCLLQGDDGLEDDDNELLRRSLCHQSSLVLQVDGLVTGFCKDVHGQLTITRRTLDGARPVIYQYKIQDKTVSFFARGLSAAVL
ncbi:elongator complex protein 6 [Dendropsophus ebraccatus]|uniref:elongator complex protein 6 n=1 Tax=Dendropsophus ebraccatus TaxID=150705 RepID=UPI0038313C97